jgi:hypothetical protein
MILTILPAILLVCFILFLVYNECDGGLGVILSTIAGLWLFGYLPDVLAYVQLHPKSCILYLMSYIGVGFIWSVFKWTKKFLDVNGATLSEIAKKTNTTPYEVYIEYMRISGRLWRNEDELKIYGDIKNLNLLDNVHLISSWIFCWPLSVIFYILGDLLVDFGKFVVRVFKKIYDKSVEIAIKVLVK